MTVRPAAAGDRYDVAVVGGGIVGTATAMSLLAAEPSLSLVVLEGEDRLAAHQSGRNSGVIHSGLYYRPGSLKAATCVEGRDALYRFCAEEGIAHRRCGKLVVAVEEEELAALGELERRGRANGLRELERLTPDEIRRREPAAAGIDGLWVGETGVVDYRAVTAAYAERLRRAGGEIRLGSRVSSVRPVRGALRLGTAAGAVECAFLVNCAGAGSDRLARRAGADVEVRIVPFRGDYFELVAERRELVRTLIYPVPDPALPFLGVHLTRRVDGRVEAGPNAVLALARERYGRFSLDPRDAWEALAFRGTWRLARRYPRTAAAELVRSLSRSAFAAALRRLVPALSAADLRRAGCGIRAQALDPKGRLVDDFLFAESERALHLLNAPSPAATASLAIGRQVARRALAGLR